MNNLTTTSAESLPKSGHVNEVCKEWLVREDGALAYKLQSQEINDFYKGNRFRNAVVREDFPTALHEQIKETEQAHQQTEAYRKYLTEQEEYDKRVAKEIAEKLERDLQEQRQLELQESEKIAQQMQEIYVNLPPVPPPAVRSRPPPRPAKASIFNNQQQQQPTTIDINTQTANKNQQHNYPLQLQQDHFSNTDNYVGLSLIPNILDLSNMRAAPPQPIDNNNHQHLVVSGGEQQQQHHQYHHQKHASIISNVSVGSSSNSSTQSTTNGAITRRKVHAITSNSPCTPNSPQHTHNANNLARSFPLSPPTNNCSNASIVEELIDYSDVADSIRRYDMTTPSLPKPSNVDALDAPLTMPNLINSNNNNNNSNSNSNNIIKHTNFNKNISHSNENLLKAEPKFQKLSPEKYDQLVGNDMISLTTANTTTTAAQQQQNTDDIEIYVDPCDYASLQEIGLPMEEIKEMSKKLKQEQKDALLARRLQEMESKDSVRQEERDRMLAIEAQDKELAKMLQEREKAKAKRAKEKARLRKSQQKNASANGSICGITTNCGPLLPLPQDCMSATGIKSHSLNANSLQHSTDAIEIEAYSNPVDVLTATSHRMPNGTLTNGSLTRDANRHNSNSLQLRDDDIYALPVDSCQRPVSLHAAAEVVQKLQSNSMSRSEHSNAEQHDDTLNGHIKYSKSSNFDQNSSPTPPYMPIQGTRRSNSSEDRKKKFKDNKCTHQ